MPLDRLVKAYKIAEKLVSGGSLENLSLEDKTVTWDKDVKERFTRWMEANNKSLEHVKDCILYLDKYMGKVSKPEDVVGLFNSCERGKTHLVKAFRNLLKFYEIVEGYPEDYLERLRKAIPKVKTGVDFTEVSENTIIETFKLLKKIPEKYATLYMVILDGGVRLTHVINMVNSFNPSRLENLGEFCRYTLGLERGTKHTFYAYMRVETVEMLKKIGGNVKITKNSIMKFVERHKLVRPKLVRKFAYNRMVLCGIPETIADFINGRKPRTVGGQHYLFLKIQADQHYPKYLQYSKEFTGKVG